MRVTKVLTLSPELLTGEIIIPIHDEKCDVCHEFYSFFIERSIPNTH